MSTSDTFQAYVDKNWSNKPTNDGSLRDLIIMTAGLGGESGEVLELIKKHVRDDRVIDAQLILELGDLLHYLTRIGKRWGWTLEQIMEANMMKLDARFDRKPSA